MFPLRLFKQACSLSDQEREGRSEQSLSDEGLSEADNNTPKPLQERHSRTKQLQSQGATDGRPNVGGMHVSSAAPC